jgi:hypothetical protein
MEEAEAAEKKGGIADLVGVTRRACELGGVPGVRGGGACCDGRRVRVAVR